MSELPSPLPAGPSHIPLQQPRTPLLARVTSFFFEAHRGPAFMIALSVLYSAMMLTLMLIPRSAAGIGAFAEEFRVWCFGLDPATGRMQPMLVAAMFSEPMLLCLTIAGIWGKEIADKVRQAPRSLVPSLASALVVVTLGGAAFGLLKRDPIAKGELPFPAEDLRTALPAPTFELYDQDGEPVSLSRFAGKVVMMTGVYASCGATCPMIMSQSRSAVNALPEAERADVVVIAVTLDPAHDDRARRAEMAQGQGVASPQFRLVGGDVRAVEALLDDLSIARRRDPVTGVIDHSNVFALFDRKGKLAYRFSLGDLQQQWLTKALSVLVREGK